MRTRLSRRDWLALPSAVAASASGRPSPPLSPDRVALLKDGAFLALGAPEQAITEASLRALYGVDVRIAERAEDGRTRRVCLPRRAA